MFCLQAGGPPAFPTTPELLPAYERLAKYLKLTEQAASGELVTLFLPGDYAMANEYEADVLAALPDPPAYPPFEAVRFLLLCCFLESVGTSTGRSGIPCYVVDWCINSDLYMRRSCHKFP